MQTCHMIEYLQNPGSTVAEKAISTIFIKKNMTEQKLNLITFKQALLLFKK